MGEGGEKTLEELFRRLEEIVKNLESGSIPLQQALDEFEEGISIAKNISSLLEKAQKKVELLMKEKEDLIRSEPFKFFGEGGDRED